MQQFPKKENIPDFSNPVVQQAFVQDARSNKELLQKELNVNQAEQVLLRKRVELMKGFINEMPSSDPHYSMMMSQVEMDQVEMDELKVREMILIQKIEGAS